MIRGVCPLQAAFPCFLTAMLGCTIRVMPDNVMSEEQHLPWNEAMRGGISPHNPWFQI